MGFKPIFLLIFVLPDATHAASIVNFGATLCGAGQQMLSGGCQGFTQGRCLSGYYQVMINISTASTAVYNRCLSLYEMQQLPPNVTMLSDGGLVNFGANLCGVGQHMLNGVCVPMVQGACPSGYTDVGLVQNTSSALDRAREICGNTYEQSEVPTGIFMAYNGVLVDFGPSLCSDGQHYTNTGCVSDVRGDCPENMHQMSPIDTTLIPLNMGYCDKNYSPYPMVANCAAGERWNGMCAVLCDLPTVYSGLGLCLEKCSGANFLRTSTGVALPVYGTRGITPSINIRTSTGDVCYVNLLSGAAADTINVQYNKKTYHAID